MTVLCKLLGWSLGTLCGVKSTVRLGEDVLRIEGEFLRFNEPEQDRVNAQRVIGRPGAEALRGYQNRFNFELPKLSPQSCGPQ